MSSSAFGRDSSSNSSSRRDSPPGDASPQPATDPALLEAVLQRTLANFSNPQSLADADIGRLREVAERHRGKPFDVEPVASELIGAILHEEMVQWSLPAGTQQAISSQIARTICDDPTARDRFAALWQRLSGTGA